MRPEVNQRSSLFFVLMVGGGSDYILILLEFEKSTQINICLLTLNYTSGLPSASKLHVLKFSLIKESCHHLFNVGLITFDATISS